eukprot:TRINITY_DN2280_c0_g1_i1.p1 TRINITY_DN2280_c0_g1~~TRINITY_DN2280_c0_g1_i1.p1  ORF type:complete len:780 (+),score=195.82 TRINITY_DN2280_c0_g1_i1:467-2806(+)
MGKRTTSSQDEPVARPLLRIRQSPGKSKYTRDFQKSVIARVCGSDFTRIKGMLQLVAEEKGVPEETIKTWIKRARCRYLASQRAVNQKEDEMRERVEAAEREFRTRLDATVKEMHERNLIQHQFDANVYCLAQYVHAVKISPQELEERFGARNSDLSPVEARVVQTLLNHRIDNDQIVTMPVIIRMLEVVMEKKKPLANSSSMEWARRVMHKLGFSWRTTQSRKYNTALNKDNVDAINEFFWTHFVELNEIIANGGHVYVMDETALVADSIQSQSWGVRNADAPRVAVQEGAVRDSLVVTLRQDGVHDIPPIFIPSRSAAYSGTTKIETAMKGMNSKAMQEYVAEFLRAAVPGPNNPVALLMDNLSAHKDEAAYAALQNSGVTVIFFPPRMAVYLSPCDNRFFTHLKKLWYNFVAEVNVAGKSLSLPDKINAIGKIVKMVPASVVVSCFKTCGLIGYRNTPQVSNAVSTNAQLQRELRMLRTPADQVREEFAEITLSALAQDLLKMDEQSSAVCINPAELELVRITDENLLSLARSQTVAQAVATAPTADVTVITSEKGFEDIQSRTAGGAPKKKKPHCTNCILPGHNRKNCRNIITTEEQIRRKEARDSRNSGLVVLRGNGEVRRQLTLPTAPAPTAATQPAIAAPRVAAVAPAPSAAPTLPVLAANRDRYAALSSFAPPVIMMPQTATTFNAVRERAVFAASGGSYPPPAPTPAVITVADDGSDEDSDSDSALMRTALAQAQTRARDAAPHSSDEEMDDYEDPDASDSEDYMEGDDD